MRRRGRCIPPFLGSFAHTPRHDIGCPTLCKIIILPNKTIPQWIRSQKWFFLLRNCGTRGCHKDAHPFFPLWHPLSDVGETLDPEVP